MVWLLRNKDDLYQQLACAGDKLVVLDFFATWCGPCKIMAPKVEELAEQYSNRAVVLKVNVDECEDIALEYNVSCMPTFVFIKAGEVVEQVVGANLAMVAKAMEKHVGGVDATEQGCSANCSGTEDVPSGGTSPSPSISADDVVICDISEHEQEAEVEH
ncbi:thioredoxin-2-like [Drosophila ficusphila]|uniref:thioredoxin-2-like n=1 Tax=Drosophila ficusphila TaxID=30025 RepID=UPI0007E8622D|nr:thioredoxin-2-like [Drosophila ficusphila]